MAPTKVTDSGPTESSVAYVIYDKKSGRIVHTHIVSTLDGQSSKKPETLKNLLGTVAEEDDLRAQLTNHDLAQATLLTTEVSDARVLVGKMVDPDKEKIVDRPRLVVEPAKEAIEGDGEARVKIAIKAVNVAGKPVKGFSGDVKVSTSRGRLSEKGGVVSLRNGTGEIELTSVAETVDKVLVTARSADGKASAGGARLEFL